MQQDGQSETAATETIDAILRLEKQHEQALALHHRVFHAIGGFVGTVHFLLLQCLGVAAWIAFNLNFPDRAVDQPPFPLLGTLLSLETVLLTSCVLIRQNLIDRTLERRNHLELQINLLAEKESTHALRILSRVAERLGVADPEHGKNDRLTHETSVDEIARDLKVREEQGKEPA